MSRLIIIISKLKYIHLSQFRNKFKMSFKKVITPQGEKLLQASSPQSRINYSKQHIPPQIVFPQQQNSNSYRSGSREGNEKRYPFNSSLVEPYSIQENDNESQASQEEENNSCSPLSCLIIALVVLLLIGIAIFLGLKVFHLDEKFGHTKEVEAQNAESNQSVQKDSESQISTKSAQSQDQNQDGEEDTGFMFIPKSEAEVEEKTEFMIKPHANSNQETESVETGFMLPPHHRMRLYN